MTVVANTIAPNTQNPQQTRRKNILTRKKAHNLHTASTAVAAIARRSSLSRSAAAAEQSSDDDVAAEADEDEDEGVVSSTMRKNVQEEACRVVGCTKSQMMICRRRCGRKTAERKKRAKTGCAKTAM